MAPKRRNKQVVGSVVKTKVVQETVEVTTAIVANQAAVEALPTVDVSGSTVVHVDVSTPDGGTTTDVNVKQQQPAKTRRSRGRRRRVEEEEETVPVVALQSQETQDPNEEQQQEEAYDAPSKKQRRQAETEEEEQPETPRVASERKPREKQEEEDEKKPKQKRRRRRRLGTSPGGDAGVGGVGGYKIYVWRVHPELGVSGRAMQVLDMMMADMFERLAEAAARLSKVNGRATLTSREVKSAVRLVLPGVLGKHAISEGVKAISKYMAA